MSIQKWGLFTGWHGLFGFVWLKEGRCYMVVVVDMNGARYELTFGVGDMESFGRLAERRALTPVELIKKLLDDAVEEGSKLTTPG